MLLYVNDYIYIEYRINRLRSYVRGRHLQNSKNSKRPGFTQHFRSGMIRTLSRVSTFASDLEHMDRSRSALPIWRGLGILPVARTLSDLDGDP